MSDKRLNNLLRHIGKVRADCELLGGRLIEAGEKELGLQLIANGQIHDNSKFRGVEWDFLSDGAFVADDEHHAVLFRMAHQQHVTTNYHHPEFWGHVDLMPRLYTAEMVCDWHARASEQGTDLMDWVRDKATTRFDFSTHGKVYKQIRELIGVLLEKQFKPVQAAR